MVTTATTYREKRWWIVALLLLAAIINYVDRQSLSILADTIQRFLSMTDVGYGNVVTAFLLSYTIAYAIAGPVCDRLGVRTSMAIFIIWWSLAEMIPPLVHSAFMLGFARMLLGLGEAGIWVVGPKAIGEAFSPAERGLAIGIYTAGSTLGATIAPPLIATLTLRFGWQSVFFSTGLAGLVWVVPWLLLFRNTTTYREQNETLPDKTSSLSVLRLPHLWILLIARMLTDPVWYFYLFWYPKFLNESGNLNLSQIGRVLWIVYLAADAGSVFGGWHSGRLIRGGSKALRARRVTMTLAALLLPLSPLIALSTSIHAMLGIAAVIAFAHMTWMVTLTATAVDLFPERQIATAFGFIAAGSGLGGMVSTQMIAHSIVRAGYLPVFCVMGLLHPLALTIVWRLRETPAAIPVGSSADPTKLGLSQ